MSFAYFSRNGTVLPIEQASVPLSSVEYSYGFGVYESLRVAHGVPYFVDKHLARLARSAETISLKHNFSEEFIQTAIRELLAKVAAETCNLKILLIGGATSEAATLYILCLNPLFPDRKLYKQGASAVTTQYERPFPQAKTLNMLPSYLAYRDASQAGVYDALLINRDGCITEGTRTNFFALQDRVITTPPAADILPGVMREAVLEVARHGGFEIQEQALPLTTISGYDGAFLTSTSARIMPLSRIDEHSWESIPAALQELMVVLEQFLKAQAA